MELYETIGTSTVRKLLASTEGVRKATLPIQPNAAAIPAGTVLYRQASGLWTPAAAAQIVDANALAVLNEDLAINSGNVAEDADAYVAGCFIDGTVKDSTGTAVTAAMKLALRKQGIFFKEDATVGTFNNEVE